MASIDNYLQTNNLPCRVYLDFTNPSNYTVTANSFTVKNLAKQNNSFLTDYNFTQTNSSRFPQVTVDGLSFINNAFLTPINKNLFSNLRSYSLIIISSGSISSTKQTAFFVEKLASKPDLLDFHFIDNKPKNQFSLLNLPNLSKFLTQFISTRKTVAFSHNLKLGTSKVNVDSSGFESYVQVDKGYLLNNFPDKFYLGNSDRPNESFSSSLQYFVFFNSAISDEHLNNLIELLLVDNYIWNNLATADWESLDIPSWDSVS